MKNIKIKKLYEENKISLKEVHKVINSKSIKNIRGRTGNIDLLFHIIEPKTEDDKEIYIGIQGIFLKEELPSNITF